MFRRHVRPILFLAAFAAAGLVAASTVATPSARAADHATTVAAVSAATTGSSICTSAKRPKLAARISRGVLAVLASRVHSVVGLKVTDARDELTCKFHQGYHFDSASVIKVTIISALLLKKGGGSARLTPHERSLAWLMITQSDNAAATALWDEVGMTDMQVFLNRAGMIHTHLSDAWGLTQITAQDEIRLLHLLTMPGKVLGSSARGYVLWLMANVVSYERWGVPAGAPADVTVHVKNGWLPDPGTNHWHINSIGAFTGSNIGYQIVILTDGDQSESYGIDTIQAAAEVINRQIAGKRAASAGLPALPSPSAAALTAPGG